MKLGLFLVFLGLLSCHEKNSSSLVSSTRCGTIVGSLDGIPVYSNGSSTGSGHSCAGTDGEFGYKYQCVEFANRYFMTKFGSPLIYCDAKDCLEAYAAESRHFTTFDNGKIPRIQKGDAIVFSGGRWGHIALVSNVDGNQITFINQNSERVYGTILLNRQTLSSWGNMDVLGIIRSKNLTASPEPFSSELPPTEEGIISCLSDCFVTVQDPLHEDPPLINIRREASIKSEKIGSALVGTQLCYLNQTDKHGTYHSYHGLTGSTYYRVEHQGESGWIWAPYASEPSCIEVAQKSKFEGDKL